MFRKSCVAFVVGLLSLSTSWAVEEYPLDRDMGGPESRYTYPIRDWIKRGALGLLRMPGENEAIYLECYSSPGEKYYIGLGHSLRIHASLEQVEASLDDVDQYDEIFPDLDDVHVVSKDKNYWVTFWEQHVPVFFIPNVKYEMSYLMSKISPDRKIYRYKLLKSKDLKFSDGVIVIERDGPQSTRFVEYDFYDANWGALETFAPSRIWGDSVEGMILSDLGLKLRAENPTWSGKEVRKKAKALLQEDWGKKCIHEKGLKKPTFL